MTLTSSDTQPVSGIEVLARSLVLVSYICCSGELGPNEREAAARERAEKELLQRELAGLLDELQQQRTALSSAQHQVCFPILFHCFAMQMRHAEFKLRSTLSRL